MSAISKITLPTGGTYDLHDSRVDSINNWQYVVATNAATTPKDVTWNNAGTTVTGTLVAASATMYKIYLVPSANGTNDIYDEYITVNTTGTTYVWEMFGNTKLPDMTQYLKNKSGKEGETAGDLAYKSSASGSVAVPKTYTFTGSSATGTISGTAAAQTFTGTGVRLQTDSQVLTGASFSGSATTSTGKFTPSGSISVGTGTANYTPAGTVTVTPSTTTKYVAASASGGGSVTAGSAASCTMPTYTVSGETLTITAGSFTANTPTAVTLPTFSSQTIATGITSASFSGTGKELKFTGTEGNISVSGTPNGSITPTKSNVTVSPAASGTATYTPGGTNAASTVSGSATVTATGSVATATTENKTVTVS